MHLHKSNNLANQKQVLSFALPFASLSIVYKKNGGLQPIWRAKLACFDFSSSKILHPKTLNPKQNTPPVGLL